MLRRNLTAASFSYLMPIAAHAHPGSHAGMHAFSIGLHHAALPIVAMIVLLTGLAIGTRRRKRSCERRSDRESVGRDRH